MKLAGYNKPGLPTRSVELAEDLTGRDQNWTQLIYGILKENSDGSVFHSLGHRSRLKSMAEAEAIVSIPEGSTSHPAGARVTAQVLEG
jgi:molybdopterin molybdotransferase